MAQAIDNELEKAVGTGAASGLAVVWFSPMLSIKSAFGS
jgi:hypothetical protein